MIDILSTLSDVKEVITTIKKEIDALKSIQSSSKENEFLVYSKAVTLLQTSIERLLKVYSYKCKVPDHVSLRIIMIEILAIQLHQFSEYLREYNEWKLSFKRSCIVTKMCKMMCKPPSSIKSKLESMFEKCFNNIREAKNHVENENKTNNPYQLSISVSINVYKNDVFYTS